VISRYGLACACRSRSARWPSSSSCRSQLATSPGSFPCRRPPFLWQQAFGIGLFGIIGNTRPDLVLGAGLSSGPRPNTEGIAMDRRPGSRVCDLPPS
jgi:hypothetical protein